MLLDLSFDSIAGAGPNAAIPHYHVNPDNCLPLKINEIFLIDSGGQYQDGTTDITRTVIVGEPTQEMQDRFTRVLKGMIDVSRIRFPRALAARKSMPSPAKASGQPASTMIMVRAMASAPISLSMKALPASTSRIARPFESGMILSNEPGFYKQNSFGIRIENLLLVHEAQDIEGGERPMLGF